ncbi:hypothetical protein KY289_030739 [Solanum tuberosum]|nr:hypothetical protein KY289_030739 [Solanum tuberosum]
MASWNWSGSNDKMQEQIPMPTGITFDAIQQPTPTATTKAGKGTGTGTGGRDEGGRDGTGDGAGGILPGPGLGGQK